MRSLSSGGFRSANLSPFPAAAFRCRRSRPREWTAASNTPGSDPIGADAEVLLDIEVVVSVAPGAAQAVYFGPNTRPGVRRHDQRRGPRGADPDRGQHQLEGPEDSWSAQSCSSIDRALSDATALGITVTVAAGDNGSSDGTTDGNNH